MKKIRNAFAIGHAALKDVVRLGGLLSQLAIIPSLNLISYHLKLL